VEEREYPERNWVCTKKTATGDSDDQTTGMFWRLFSYIQGANQDQAKIPMTTPVTTLVTPSAQVDQSGFFNPSICGRQSMEWLIGRAPACDIAAAPLRSWH
jgi:hypothetical protein